MVDMSVDARAMGRSGFSQAMERVRPAALLPVVFLVSLMIPIPVTFGTFILLPHRVVLLFVFVPLLFRLLSGAAGRLLMADVLMMFATAWAVLSLLISGGGGAIETAGIFAVEFFGAYLLARTSVRSRADFERMLQFALLAMTFIAPLAMIESVTQRPILLDLIPGSISPSFQDPRLGLRRAQSVFSHPILFGVFASSFFGMFYFGLRHGRRVRGATLAVVGTFFSLSTGALISIVIQAGLIGWEVVLRRVRSRWMLFALLCVVGYIALDLVSERSPFHTLVQYASFSTASGYNRLHIWTFGTLNVAENPLFGLGVNIEDWKRAPWMSSSTDNFWLYMAMAYGLPMIGAFVAAIVCVIRALARAKLQLPEDRAYRAGILVSLGGVIVSGGTVHYWHTMMAFVMFLFGVGLWMAAGGASSGASAAVEAEDVERKRAGRAGRFRTPTGKTERPRLTRGGGGLRPSLRHAGARS